MTSAASQFLTLLPKKLVEVAEDQVPILESASEVCASALASRHVLHIYDSGHIVSHELIARTGGLVAYTRLAFEGGLSNDNLWRKEQLARSRGPVEAAESERKLISWVLSQGTMQKGDVLIIGSVSGISIRVVELAIQARDHGMSVIALTAPSFSLRLGSKHPSGKRLCEVADLVLDNHAGYGDAFFQIEGVEGKICPFSGLSATALMWALTAGIVERLRDMGIQPSIYPSVNLPDGPARVATIETRYREQGI